MVHPLQPPQPWIFHPNTINMSLFRSVSIIFAAFGLLSHLCYFIRGEHHKDSVRILSVFAMWPPTLFIMTLVISDVPTSTKVTIVAAISYFATLIISISSYRMWFHPLRHFPGPLPYRLSKISQTLRLLPKSDNFSQADRLHQKFGQIVRNGPNELSILDPDAIAAIHSSGSRCTKAPWYDSIGGPNPSLQLTRDRATHDTRRRLWDPAFSTKALREYTPRIVDFVDQFVMHLEKLEGRPMNASLWLNFYSFDVMGDLAFGKSFDMMKSREKHFTLKLLHEAMRPLGILTPIQWVFPILLCIPGAANGTKAFTKFIEDQAEVRRKNSPIRPDISSWLLEEQKDGPSVTEEEQRWLNGDTGLMIVAGSDTTAATLAHIFYYLARDEKLLARLREELENTLPKDSKFLGAIINETLRLHPPVPSGPLRQTPAGGMMFKNTFIPGGVTISVPTWSLGRLETAFPKANEFIPERWTTSPELIKCKSASIPFSTGPYSCVGKHLALLSMRIVVARLVMHFDIQFAPGETGKSLLNDTKDVFTLEVAPLYLTFVPRAKELAV